MNKRITLPGILHIVTQAVYRIMQKLRYSTAVFLDHFFLRAASLDLCKGGVLKLMSFSENWALPWPTEKVQAGSMSIVFLGILMNSTGGV